MPKLSRKIPNSLTLQEIEFVKHYVASACKDIKESLLHAGYEKESTNFKNTERFIKYPLIVSAIKKEQERIAYLLPMLPSFQEKADILWKMVYDCKDDSQERASALKAIAELNKMQGHYSAEKHVVLNLNADADVEITRALVQEYKRDY